MGGNLPYTEVQVILHNNIIIIIIIIIIQGVS